MSARHLRATRAGVLALALTALPIIGAASSASAASIVKDPITTTDNFGTLYGSAVNRDGTLMATPNYDNNTVTIIDPATGTAEFISDDAFNGPISAAFSADGSTLYVVNYDDSNIVIIDVATRTVTGTHGTENSENIAVGVSPDGSKLLVTDDYDYLTAFDLTTNLNELWNIDTAYSYNQNMAFPDDDHVTLIDYDGGLETFTLADGVSQGSTSVSGVGGYTTCVSTDNSEIAWVNDLDVVISDLDGNTLVSRSDFSAEGSQTLWGCSFTNTGALLLSDFDYSDGGTGQLLVLDSTSLDTVEQIAFPNVGLTGGVGVMADCTVVVPSYDVNVGLATLDATACNPPTTPPTTPATLASTGANLSTGAATAALLALAGVTLLAVRARRA